MIERVKVKNYKSIADVDVELGKLNVLVGRNGAGKSTFVDVLRFVRDGLKVGLEMAITEREGIAALCRWTQQSRPLDIEIELATRDGDETGQHSFVLGRVKDSYKVKHEYGRAYGVYEPFDDFPPVFDVGEDVMEIRNGVWLTAPPYPDSPPFYDPSDRPRFADTTSLQLVSATGSDSILAGLKNDLRRTSFYTIFPNTLRELQRPHTDSILLDHGQNLGTALKHIISQNIWFADLIAAMRELVDDVIDIRVKAIGGYLVTELRHDSPGKRQKWFNLSQESDGTLRMLGLLVALYQDPAPTLIAIEEPELTIHPGALSLLAEILREASGRTQILVTTQSPDLISQFKMDELRVVEMTEGITKIGMLEEAQRETVNSQLFSGGDLLRIEGLRREPTELEAVNA